MKPIIKHVMTLLREGLPSCRKATAREAGELTAGLGEMEEETFRDFASPSDFKRYAAQTDRLLGILSKLGLEALDSWKLRDDNPLHAFLADRVRNATTNRFVKYPDGHVGEHCGARENGPWRRGHLSNGLFDQAEQDRWNRKLRRSAA